MLRRKIIDLLIQWKLDPMKQSLIIEGARQVGKTYAIKTFAEQEYTPECRIFINFELENEAKVIFEGDITGDALWRKLQIRYRDKIHTGKRTLLFLDEIQACPEAITALKSFTLDGRFDVIASGSLLGAHYALVSSFPVGYVQRMTLRSLDFEEFLWAKGHTEVTLSLLQEIVINQTKVEGTLHALMVHELLDYIALGGMPEVINHFLIDKDYSRALKTQQKIVNDYRSDIAKYAEKTEKANARACFESIPFQLGKDNKKFQFKYVTKGGRSSKYESSIQWLLDSGILLKCSALTATQMPLASYKRPDAYKLYMADNGLLVSMLGQESQSAILFGDIGISKGAIFENLVAMMLTALGKELYYYEKSSTLEIDFITYLANKITGLEVKRSDNTQSKSLKSLIQNHEVPQAIKLSMKDVVLRQSIMQYPLYAVFLFPKLFQ